MICDWCGHPIASYDEHFVTHDDCRLAALHANRPPAAQVIELANTEIERARIRRQSLRDLARTQRRDRLEHPSLATYARHDRQGRT